MSLFSKLLNLHSSPKPTEDFFTEVFAYVLDTEPGILDKWLKSINIIDPDDNLIGSPPVLTQVEYHALEHHAQANRPDVKIALSTNKNENIVIFIESKIGSQEGNEQLKRYAEILEKYHT